MKALFTILLLSVALFAYSQDEDIQSSPEGVMEEVFRAAQTGDFSNLASLCPPEGGNDGDTQEYICDIASSSEEQQKEFKKYFNIGRINGEVTINETSKGYRVAKVPFVFYDGNETMNLVEIDGKWYLASF